MRFLKAHYEKIILSIVLLGLAAAAALMPMKVSEERRKEEDRKMQLIGKKVNPFPPIDMSTNQQTLARLDKPEKVKLSGEHNLFNPVRWQKTPTGDLIKGSVAGLNAVKITAINPLKLKIAYDGTSGSTQENNLKYVIGVTKETDRSGKQRRTATPGTANPIFKLESINGPPENPTDLTILLSKETEPITITPTQPYERVIGYSADLDYPPENLKKKNLRVKDELSFGGETYTVVAITQNEVVLSAKSNKKQTTIELKPQ
jgi:hypothetical protein